MAELEVQAAEVLITPEPVELGRRVRYRATTAERRRLVTVAEQVAEVLEVPEVQQ
jgi:hypothetical protein